MTARLHKTIKCVILLSLWQDFTGWCRAAISLIGLNVIVYKSTLLVLLPFSKFFHWALYQMDASDDSKILL